MADLGGQGRCGTDFPTGAPRVYNFDLLRVEPPQHGGGGWCWMNLDSGKVAPWLPPSRKLKARRTYKILNTIYKVLNDLALVFVSLALSYATVHLSDCASE